MRGMSAARIRADHTGEADACQYEGLLQAQRAKDFALVDCLWRRRNLGGSGQRPGLPRDCSECGLACCCFASGRRGRAAVAWPCFRSEAARARNCPRRPRGWSRRAHCADGGTAFCQKTVHRVEAKRAIDLELFFAEELIPGGFMGEVRMAALVIEDV